MLDLYLLRPGEHDLEILPSVSRVREGGTILRPAEDPRPPIVRRLVGGPGWRVRVGDYRVVRELEDAAREVNAVRVRDRWAWPGRGHRAPRFPSVVSSLRRRD